MYYYLFLKTGYRLNLTNSTVDQGLAKPREAKNHTQEIIHKQVPQIHKVPLKHWLF
jgi:hypothetical protein